MGKIFHKDKLGPKILTILMLSSVTLFLAVLLTVADTFASNREFELFDKGYEYYLSYKPEKAVETFTLFLNEFPRSSARDAALFWLGKSFLQLKSLEKAEEMFSSIKREFPESPFLPYAERESAGLGKAETAPPVAEGGKEGEIVQQARVEEGQMKKDLPEQEPPKISQDSEKQKVDLPEEGKKTEELKVATTERVEDATARKSPEPALATRTDGPYTVQVGALANQKAANRLRVKLERKGYKATVKGMTSDKGKLFKVTVGKFDTKKEAAAFAVKLKKAAGVSVFPVEIEPARREEKVQLAVKTQPKEQEGRDKASLPEGEKKETEQTTLAAKSEQGAETKQPSDITNMAKAEITPEAKPTGEDAKGSPSEQKAPKTAEEGIEQKPLPEESKKTEEVTTETAERLESKTPAVSTAKGTERAGDVKYTVQVGAYSSRKAAERIRARCEKEGYVSTIIGAASDRGRLYKVTAGNFLTKREAEEFSIRVKKVMGLYAFPVEMGRVAGKGDVRSGRENLPSVALSEKTSGAEKIERSEKPGQSQKYGNGDVPRVRIKGKEYGISEISGFIESSSAALAKSGIREIPWRSGDIFKDFVNEQVLYDAAKDSGIVVATGQLEELRGRYNLAAEEADYLERYLAINGFVQRKMESVYGERLVESLVVKYERTGNQKKAALASTLQEEARKGKSFEELARLYPDMVTLSVIRLRDLQGSVKDSIKRSDDGEVSVVWTKGGYMLLKPVGIPAREDAMKVFVRGWVEELKRNSKLVR